MISIIIPTYNAESSLSKVLEGIFTQVDVGPFEVIVIDSSSSDRTREIAASFPLQWEAIAKKDFSHPGTRNRGVRRASGAYVVFLTQDAVPANPWWLNRLIAPLKSDGSIAGSYGRQVPRPEATDWLEIRELAASFPAESSVRRLTLPGEMQKYLRYPWPYTHFSDSSAAYRRELLLEHPFNEALPLGEDQEWAKRMLEAGHAIAYAADSEVVHSHDFTWKETLTRFPVHGRAFAMFMPRLKPLGVLWESLRRRSAQVTAGDIKVTRIFSALARGGALGSLFKRLVRVASFYYGWRIQKTRQFLKSRRRWKSQMLSVPGPKTSLR